MDLCIPDPKPAPSVERNPPPLPLCQSYVKEKEEERERKPKQRWAWGFRHFFFGIQTGALLLLICAAAKCSTSSTKTIHPALKPFPSIKHLCFRWQIHRTIGDFSIANDVKQVSTFKTLCPVEPEKRSSVLPLRKNSVWILPYSHNSELR